ncbi:MAG: thymidine phosphorylase family protein [Cyclobacteriaceae bacterium]|nr:thymidine phosphorylase family protein [Cyclobacteriaceae bacterium]
MATSNAPKSPEFTPQTNNGLQLVDLGIDTQQEHFVFLKADSPIVVSEGFETLTRIRVHYQNRTIVATLSVIQGDLIAEGQVGLSENACKTLKVKSGAVLRLSHLPPLSSLGLVRSKINGNKLSEGDFMQIINDIEKGRYSGLHIASFITACYGDNLDIEEMTSLTKSMVATGAKLDWGKPIVVDKHCVGGLPGNRTTPIVVALVAAAGLTIPKTSSRAITSPAGTADTMETMAPVNLTLDQIREVIEKEGGCISWGSAAGLSPVDERIIKVERALDIDSEGQMIASILSKKVAVGSTHVVVDIPVGPTAKVRTEEKAQRLKYKLNVIGNAIGLEVKVLITDGTQPIGQGIGPALEARDVLAVLQNKPRAPKDLRTKSTLLAGTIFEAAGICVVGKGQLMAEDMLSGGKAWDKFKAICQAQGGMKEPTKAPYQHQVLAPYPGIISSIDNRKLAKVAKLAGAPYDAAAGIEIFEKIGAHVEQGGTLFTIHSESSGELKYALKYVNSDPNIITIS